MPVQASCTCSRDVDVQQEQRKGKSWLEGKDNFNSAPSSACSFENNCRKIVQQ